MCAARAGGLGSFTRPLLLPQGAGAAPGPGRPYLPRRGCGRPPDFPMLGPSMGRPRPNREGRGLGQVVAPVDVEWPCVTSSGSGRWLTSARGETSPTAVVGGCGRRRARDRRGIPLRMSRLTRAAEGPLWTLVRPLQPSRESMEGATVGDGCCGIPGEWAAEIQTSQGGIVRPWSSVHRMPVPSRPCWRSPVTSPSGTPPARSASMRFATTMTSPSAGSPRHHAGSWPVGARAELPRPLCCLQPHARRGRVTYVRLSAGQLGESGLHLRYEGVTGCVVRALVDDSVGLGRSRP